MQNIVSAWQDFKVKKISLITATAVTNSCIHILERLAGDLEMEYNHLGDIDSLICTLYFQHEIRLIVCQFGLSYHKALDLLVRSIAAHTPRLHEGFIKHIMKSAKVNEENAADIFMLCVQSYFNKVESFLNWSQLLGNDNNIQSNYQKRQNETRVLT